ncbi:MAG: hypothetical protein WCG95_08185 [bacterium]
MIDTGARQIKWCPSVSSGVKNKTYLLALNSGDYSEAACALVEVGADEAAAVAEARGIVRAFADKHQGWCSLEWGWTLRCVVLKRVPDSILSLLGEEDQDELFPEGGPTWLVLPDGFDWSNGDKIPDDEIWRSECEGLRCTADSVYFTALDKYTSEHVESDDLEAIFFPTDVV